MLLHCIPLRRRERLLLPSLTQSIDRTFLCSIPIPKCFSFDIDFAGVIVLGWWNYNKHNDVECDKNKHTWSKYATVNAKVLLQKSHVRMRKGQRFGRRTIGLTSHTKDISAPKSIRCQVISRSQTAAREEKKKISRLT